VWKAKVMPQLVGEYIGVWGSDEHRNPAAEFRLTG
jgi:hypothetical protein